MYCFYLIWGLITIIDDVFPSGALNTFKKHCFAHGVSWPPHISQRSVVYLIRSRSFSPLQMHPYCPPGLFLTLLWPNRTYFHPHYPRLFCKCQSSLNLSQTSVYRNELLAHSSSSYPSHSQLLSALGSAHKISLSWEEWSMAGVTVFALWTLCWVMDPSLYLLVAEKQRTKFIACF